jgi:hypothetical protein
MIEPEIVLCFSNGIRHELKTVEEKINCKNGYLTSIKVVAPDNDNYTYALTTTLPDNSSTSAMLSSNEGNLMRFKYVPVKGKSITLTWTYNSGGDGSVNIIWSRNIQFT